MGTKLAIIIGVVSLTVIMAMGGALWWSQEKLSAANKTIGNQAGQIIGLEGAIKFQIKLSQVNKENNLKYNEQESEFDARLQGVENEYKAQLRTAFSDAHEAPADFDDRLNDVLIKWMCEIHTSRKPSEYSTCVSDSQAAQLDGQPLTITITEKEVAEYKRGCGLYKDALKYNEMTDDLEVLRDTCHYSITGFTPETLYGIFLPYLSKVSAEVMALNRHIDVLNDLIAQQGGSTDSYGPSNQRED